MSRVLVWLAARIVPGARRAEWIERWQAELWVVAHEREHRLAGLSLAAGAFPDALAEFVDGWRDGWSWDGLIADVRDAWRAARRAPALTLTGIAILGLGAASAATIFSLADALLLRPPPGLDAPDRLVQIGRKDAASFDTFSFPNYLDLRDGLAESVTLAAWANTAVVVGDGAGAEVVRAQQVSTNYFSVVGAAIAAGPGFSTVTPAAGGRELVVSDSFWRRHGQPAVGTELAVDGQAYRIAGVALPGFVGVDAGSGAPHLWVPISSATLDDFTERRVERGWSWLRIVGRLAPGTSMAAAREATVAVHRRLAEAHAATIGDTVTFAEGVGLDPPSRALAGQLIATFMAAALLVLAVATANVAGLQLSRNLGRRHELAVRLSLGASRRRVFRTLLVEQALWAVVAGAVAFAQTWWTSAWLLTLLPYDIAVPPGPTPRLLLFALVASVLATTVIGWWPLATAVRSVPADILRTRHADPRRQRLGQVLVGLELAVTAVLLCLTVLMARSVMRATDADPGFAPDGVVALNLRLLPGRSADGASVMADALARVRALPGVTTAAFATSLPVVDPQSSRVLMPPGAAYAPDPARVVAVSANVSDGFFSALGLPIAAGRPLEARDRVGAEVPAVINASLASALFAEAPAVGRTFDAGPVVYRVVGVAAQTSLRSLRDRQLPAMWLPLDARGEWPARLIVRTTASSNTATDLIRGALEPLQGDLMVRDVTPLAPLVARSLGNTVLMAQLATVFGGLALLISAVGMHAVSSAQVQRRRHEIGVRLAVGAVPATVVRGMLRVAVLTAAAGCVVGVAGIVLAEAQLRAFLFDVQAADPIAIAVTLGVLSAVSIAAVIGPAVRAGRTDPLIVMRES